MKSFRKFLSAFAGLGAALKSVFTIAAVLICVAAAAQSITVIRSGNSTNTAQVDSSGNLKVTTGAGSASTPTKTTTTISSNASACTAAGGSSCTIILASTEVVSYSRLALTIMNTGSSNAFSNCLVEFSPDGTSWEVWDSSTFGTLAAGAITSIQIGDNSRRYIRVEARSASGTTSDVWLTMLP